MDGWMDGTVGTEKGKVTNQYSSCLQRHQSDFSNDYN